MLRLLMVLLVAPVMINVNAAVFMDAEWAEEMCEAWNNNETLTTKLDGFMKNDLGRGYKLFNLERRDCSEEGSAPVQFKLQAVGGQTKCVYGGEIVDELDFDADYAMAATTGTWRELGNAGKLRLMAAMTVGALGFKGPKTEAMANMGSFLSFLNLVGISEAELYECPL